MCSDVSQPEAGGYHSRSPKTSSLHPIPLFKKAPSAQLEPGFKKLYGWAPLPCPLTWLMLNSCSRTRHPLQGVAGLWASSLDCPPP